jgi:hypothetical protein
MHNSTLHLTFGESGLSVTFAVVNIPTSRLSHSLSLSLSLSVIRIAIDVVDIAKRRAPSFYCSRKREFSLYARQSKEKAASVLLTKTGASICMVSSPIEGNHCLPKMDL